MARFITPNVQALDATGASDAGAKLYFYTTGTATLLNTYSDEDLTIPNTNPVVADGNGFFGDIFLQQLAYKVIYKDADDVTLWTSDPVGLPLIG